MPKPSQLALGLSPVVLSLGFVLWVLSLAGAGRLPDPIATHWGVSGEADGFASLGVHLAWATFALAVPTAIWLAVVFYPKVPPTIRIVVLVISAAMFFLMLAIQVSAVAIQIDVGDARASEFDFPFLIILIPIAGLLILFLSMPVIDIDTRLRILLRGLPLFSCDYSEISEVRVGEASWKNFGGLGLRISGKQVAFLPNSGPVIEIETKAGEIILVRTDSAQQQVDQIRGRMNH